MGGEGGGDTSTACHFMLQTLELSAKIQESVGLKNLYKRGQKQ